ncbi:MAG: hypothetical protein RLZZ282_1476, partial [Verrucomicrobiota bacterium]
MIHERLRPRSGETGGSDFLIKDFQSEPNVESRLEVRARANVAVQNHDSGTHDSGTQRDRPPV